MRILQRRERRRNAPAGADLPVCRRRRRGAGRARPRSTEVDHSLGRIKNLLILIAGGGIAIAAALGLAVVASGARAGASADRRDGERRRDRRPVGPDRGQRPRRAQQARGQLQRDARRARGVGRARSASSSPTRRTSCARRSRACGRTSRCSRASARCPPGARAAAHATSSTSSSEMTTLIGEPRSTSRAASSRPAEPEEVRLDLVAAEAVERARRNRPAVTFTTDLQETMVQRRPGDDRACGRKPARQRREVEPAGRRGRGGGRETARSACATTAPASTRRISLTSSTASIASPIRARPAGLGARARDRPPGRRGARRRGRRGAGRRRRNAHDAPPQRRFLGSS